MKKITLLIVFLFAFLCSTNSIAQVSDVANWPNANWSIAGSYSASGLTNNPTTTANFTWDDDLAGSGSLDDIISAVSPVIDLTPAITAGELQVEVLLDYIYKTNGGDVVTLDWWNQDNNTWVVWETFIETSTSETDYKGCSPMTAFTSQPLTISTFTATQLLGFKYRLQFNDGGFDFGVCFGSPTLQSIDSPDCLDVTAITIDPTLITDSQAVIDWTENNSPPPTNGWEIEYGPTGFVQGTGTIIAVGIQPYTLAPLNANTTYDIYIRAICSATLQSEWTGPVSFTTELDIVGCGDQYIDSGGASGNYANNEDFTTTICPDVAGEVVTLNFLSFNTELGNDILTIYDGDDTTATVLGTFSGTTVPPTFTSSHSSGCLTFNFDSDGSLIRDGWVADIICGPPPTCFAVSAIATTNITIDGVEISWTDNNTPAPANGWEVEIVVSGTTPTGTGVTATSPYVVTGLDSDTQYDIYIRAICDDGGTDDPSFWTGPTSFITLVGPPECGGQFTDSGGQFANYSDNEDITTVICPDTAGEVVTIQFLTFNTEGCCDDLSIYDGDDATAPLLGTFAGTTLPPTFTSTHSSGCLTFVFESDLSVTRDGFTANVICSPPPTCFAVEDILVDNILSDSITLSWTDTINAVPPTEYIIEYGPVGFAQGTGTIVNAPTNPFTVNSLNSQTTYEFYVQASCDVTDQSFWVGPIQATTSCSVFTAPYTEDFEDGGVIDVCWSQGSSNAEDWRFSNNVAFPGHVGNDDNVSGTVTSSGGYFAWVDDSSAHNTGTTLESPLVDVSSLTTPALSFYYVSHDEGQTHVDFSVDVWDGAAWNVGMFTSATNTAGWEKIFINLETLTITGPVKARFIVDENNGNDFYDDVAIDDVTFDEAPSCFDVTGLVLDNETATSFDVSWTDNNTVAPVGGWTIEYGPAGFVQGTGTLVNVPLPTPSTTISGLSSSTQYDVYVRANCAADDSDSSFWTGPQSITTDPTCFDISNLVLDNETTTSFDVSWTDNNTVAPVGGWTIEYGPAGFVQGTGTLVNVPLPTPSTSITGLFSSTDYDVYVRANCAVDTSDSSLWVGPSTIRTDDAPPPNDTCITAIVLPVELNCVVTVGNNILATSSTDNEGEILPDCADPAANGDGTYEALDVWYEFVVPSSGNVAIETSSIGGGMVDTVLAAYTGSCGNLVELDCQDDSVINPNSPDFRFSSITLRDLTVGDTIYLRVWSYDHFNQGNIQGAFNICVYGQSRRFNSQLEEEDFIDDEIQISYYPNPVTDILTVSSDREISEIAIYTLLGQEVLRETYNNQTNVTLGMQNISAGTYFAKTLVNGTIKTFKVIKK